MRRKFSITKISISVFMKQTKASLGVHIIGSPLLLKDVLIRTGHPVFLKKRSREGYKNLG